MWYEAGEDISLLIDFTVDGQFVAPSLARAVVRDTDGVVLHSVGLTTGGTSATLLVPAAVNVITNAAGFEDRFLTVTFTHEGGPHSQQRGFKLRSFVPITGTPAQVRAELGLDYSELPDTDIDIYSAYFRLVAVAGVQFGLAHTAGGTKGLAANQAVVVQAAIDVSESLILRTAITSRAEDHQFSRSTNIDFDKLAGRLRTKLSVLILAAQGATTTTSAIFAVSDPTDVVTGE